MVPGRRAIVALIVIVVALLCWWVYLLDVNQTGSELSTWHLRFGLAGVFSTAAVGWFTYTVLHKTKDVLEKTNEISEHHGELLRESQLSSQRTEQMRMVLSFHQRFSNILEMPRDEQYYNRYWHAQYDQYHAWRNGYVPDDFYEYWLRIHFRRWRTNHDHHRHYERVVSKWHRDLGDFSMSFEKVMNRLHLHYDKEWIKVDSTEGQFMSEKELETRIEAAIRATLATAGSYRPDHLKFKSAESESSPNC